jgi:hypothetical protein
MGCVCTAGKLWAWKVGLAMLSSSSGNSSCMSCWLRHANFHNSNSNSLPLLLFVGKKKKSLADFAIVRRIHFIFERSVRKFKTDLGLWTSWLEFCKSSNSNRRLGRVVARALQIHPTGRFALPASVRVCRGL